MELAGWNFILFASKWLFITLIYFALLTVLLAVRREMSQRLVAERRMASVAPGRLQVINPGSDPSILRAAVFILQPEMSLGTARDNDIVIDDRFVSRHHAHLRWDGVDWWLEDLNSRNGSYVNENRCPPHQPQLVPLGATVQLGGMVFKLLE